MKKNDLAIFLAAFFFPLSYLPVSAQYPQINWWYDTYDASFGQTASADIDGDGYLELVFGCYRNDSSVYALNAEDGSLLWKYNTASPGVEGCNDVAPVIFDLDGDDTLEVVVPASCNPTTFCFNGLTGKVKWTRSTRGSDSPPTIADLDDDGMPEILHGEFGGYVICINGENGSLAWEIPVDLNSWIQTAPSIADLDSDGKPDFVVATWNATSGDTNKVYAYRGYDHHLLWTFPLADVTYHGTAVADLDEDGLPELVIGDYSGRLYVLNGEDGSLAWDYIWEEDYYIGAPATIADLDNDNSCEVILVSWFKVIALKNNGTLLWHYSIPDYGTAFRGTAVADINSDEYPDMIFGTSEGRLIVLNGLSGAVLVNTDLSAHIGKSFEIDHAPVIADFDKDGDLDAFLVGGHAEYPNFQNDYGRGYCVSLGVGSGPEWLMFQHDVQRNSALCNGIYTLAGECPDKAAPGFRAFPNPLSGMTSFFSDYPGLIRIYDPYGRLVKELRIENPSVRWDGCTAGGKKLSPGLYTASLTGPQGKQAIKLLVQ